MWTQNLPLTSTAPRPARRQAAAVLRAASRMLDRMATALTNEAPLRRPDAVLEFHAESGAPEGALYVDGEWIGNLLGVNRL